MIPKVAVYSIAKNEEQFIERYYNSCKDADLIIVGVCDDTTDNTKELLSKYNIQVIDISVHPWRFDVARNIVLDAIPDDIDICISLDLDEVLLKGWRDGLNSVYKPEYTSIRYPYIFSWQDKEMKKPFISQQGFKIHKPKAYKWQYPIHEILVPLVEENVISTTKIQINHYPDYSKERPYQGLLDLACQENPLDTRMSYLRGRELFRFGRYDEAIEELNHYLHIFETDYTKPYEYQERASAFRLIGRCKFNKGDNPYEILQCMIRSLAEAPTSSREAWFWLGEAFTIVENYPSAYSAYLNASMITDKKMSYECEEVCWDNYRLNKNIERCIKKMNGR